MAAIKFKRACIVTHSYMTYDGSRRAIGGIQSYVDALQALLQPICGEIIIIQAGDIAFEIELDPKVKLIGVPTYDRPLARYYRRNIVSYYQRNLARYYQKNLAGKCDVTICMHLSWAQWCSGPRLIAVQHGIGWDGYGSNWRGLPGWLRKRHYAYYEMWRKRRRLLRVLSKLDKLICVDLNFPNWLRATYPTGKWEETLAYVPNFGDPIAESVAAAKLAQDKGHTDVLIARRFEKIRGLPLMAEVVSDIYDDWPEARFVFAGWGSQKQRMKEILADKQRCEIVRLTPEEVEAANLKADIVAIPTIWSEGTSLSCIEGMCAAAAVLSTSIGGLGNLILPEYNGLLVPPTYAGIRGGLERILGDVALRTTLARRGYETAKASFSRDAWSRRIIELLAELE